MENTNDMMLIMFVRFYGNDKRMLFKDANIANLTMRSSSNDSVASESATYADALPSLSAAPGEPAGASLQAVGSRKGISYECGICLITEQLPVEQSFHLTCGHRFCTECWREYITHSILKEGERNIIHGKT